MSLPSGEELRNIYMLKNCKVLMHDRMIYADFIVLTMSEFDVIFGMEWLAQFGATTDCKRKTVCLSIHGEVSFVFHTALKPRSSFVILACTARPILRGGCVGFFESVTMDFSNHVTK